MFSCSLNCLPSGRKELYDSLESHCVTWFLGQPLTVRRHCHSLVSFSFMFHLHKIPGFSHWRHRSEPQPEFTVPSTEFQVFLGLVVTLQFWDRIRPTRPAGQILLYLLGMLPCTQTFWFAGEMLFYTLLHSSEHTLVPVWHQCYIKLQASFCMPFLPSVLSDALALWLPSFIPW